MELIVRAIVIAYSILALMFIVYVPLVVVSKFFMNIRNRRRAAMDDTVDHDEWRAGSPDTYVPENATPINLESKE